MTIDVKHLNLNFKQTFITTKAYAQRKGKPNQKKINNNTKYIHRKENNNRRHYNKHKILVRFFFSDNEKERE